MVLVYYNERNQAKISKLIRCPLPVELHGECLMVQAMMYDNMYKLSYQGSSLKPWCAEFLLRLSYGGIEG